ncbi:hypothetical protein SAMN06296386_11323 [Lachnospiraceae bacterium]|nr:hypothetical protein SAMN06296386_11323 [Lachnospiraceae bacterium]
MSNFTVTNNYYLYNLYKENSLYAIKEKREGVKSGKLLAADTKALLKGVKVLGSENYGDEKDDTNAENKRLYKKLKSFADAYNYTMESSKEFDSRRTRKIRKEMDALKEKYADKLEAYGITFSDKGYMKLSKTTIDGVDNRKFEKYFGEESEFSNTVKKLAKKLYNHVDYQA